MKKNFLFLVILMVALSGCSSKQSKNEDISFCSEYVSVDLPCHTLYSVGGEENILVLLEERLEGERVIQLYDVLDGELKDVHLNVDVLESGDIVTSVEFDGENLYLATENLMKQKYAIVITDKEGNFKSRLDCTEISKEMCAVSNSDFFAISKLMFREGRLFLMSVGQGMAVVWPQTMEYECFAVEEVYDFSIDSNGDFFFTCYDTERSTPNNVVYNLQKGRLDENYTVQMELLMTADGNINLFNQKTVGERSYAYSDKYIYCMYEKGLEIVDSLNDIGGYAGQIEYAVEYDEDRLMLLTAYADVDDDVDQMHAELIFLQPNREKRNDRQLITMVVPQSSSIVDEQIKEFNRTNENYYIEAQEIGAIDYAEELNVLVLSGKTPDIIRLGNIDYSIYAEKGVLEDLSENVNVLLQTGKYYENVLRVMQYNEKIVGIPVCFQLESQLINANVSMDYPYTVKEFDCLLNERFNAQLSLTGKLWVLDLCMFKSGRHYVNLENNKILISGDELREILEFSQKNGMDKADTDICIEYYSGIVPDTYVLEQLNEMMTKDGKPIASFIGFPYTEGNGSVLNAWCSFGISSTSDYQEAAWSFIESFFEDDVQADFFRGGSFSVIKDINEVYLNDKYVQTGIISDEMYGMLMELMGSATKIEVCDENVKTIILEEAAGYFSGDVSLDETIEYILERLQIYVDEN